MSITCVEKPLKQDQPSHPFPLFPVSHPPPHLLRRGKVMGRRKANAEVCLHGLWLLCCFCPPRETPRKEETGVRPCPLVSALDSWPVLGCWRRTSDTVKQYSYLQSLKNPWFSNRSHKDLCVEDAVFKWREDTMGQGQLSKSLAARSKH